MVPYDIIVSYFKLISDYVLQELCIATYFTADGFCKVVNFFLCENWTLHVLVIGTGIDDLWSRDNLVLESHLQSLAVENNSTLLLIHNDNSYGEHDARKSLTFLFQNVILSICNDYHICVLPSQVHSEAIRWSAMSQRRRQQLCCGPMHLWRLWGTPRSWKNLRN